ncbi:fungal-specific transcription factor domain-containing protein [Epithele typhae]|uniref:fungal-specific transcription factor domain-containing protein n=1 Tax=Epithele typhae TaxID=378194 RepID=UPI0020076D9A|nr:fungal-specific transcription factor domain-containing protein [Epithele typhae]KAH9944251.1 fungal-specific transcription factor domain-containing protein [Epithele typhae]
MASIPDQNPTVKQLEEDETVADHAAKLAGVKRGTHRFSRYAPLRNSHREHTACDRCRKIKSKCEVGTDERCQNCEIAGTRWSAPVFLPMRTGPSFKRGPPKGYIHSIEQRWHQVECILATIMESPGAQAIMTDLRGDSFASAILDRVQAGPYGSRGRMNSRHDLTTEGFYASLVDVPEHTPAREDRRSRRQSRVSREIVSQDPTASATPTREWQDQLFARLAHGTQWGGYSSSPMSPPSRSSSSTGNSSDYARTRRRLEQWPLNIPDQQNWDNMYTMSDSAQPADVLDEAAEAFGHLSVDQNKEFRYHGPASGLPLLAQSHGQGDDKQKNRIWRFMANVDPESPSHDLINEEEDVEVDMPAPDVQRYLLELYFTYVHPFFPVIHKQDFLYQYGALSNHPLPATVTTTSLHRHPMQRPCKMLLLSMFAIAARYSDRVDDHPLDESGAFSKAGQSFAVDAHKLLGTDRKYQSSRPSTCQALLLLAIREFGMGAMDKGWLYSGMAMRMAIDLGINRNTESWTVDGKQPLFSDVEKQIRKHIWWSCCMSDKLSAVWLGRPITFRANDYSIPLPKPDEVDENEPWEPYPPGILGHFTPQTSRLMTSFKQACHLSVIITDIMDKIYPVEPPIDIPRRVVFEQLETRLAKWQIDLPEPLRYNLNDKNANVLPHVLVLHTEYHAAVLLLHRALPIQSLSNTAADPLTLKALDACSAAAVHISTLAETYHERFGLERAPAFLCIYLQAAGIMHVVTLSRRPWDPQATLGLTRCIAACRRIERLWPTATNLRQLLEGAKVRLDESNYPVNPPDANRRKRSVDHAFGGPKNTDIHSRGMHRPTDGLRGPGASVGASCDRVQNTPFTQSLGGPAPEMPTTFYPGYQWWPTQLMTPGGLQGLGLTAPMDIPPVSAPMPYSSLPSYSPTQVPQGSHPQDGYVFAPNGGSVPSQGFNNDFTSYHTGFNFGPTTNGHHMDGHRR